MFALVGAAITFTVGPLIVRFLYGGEYTLAGDVIRYYSLVIPVVFWGVLSSRWLIEQELQKLLLMRNLIGFTTNISLNLLLIPKFGLYGATIATICAQVASVCIATGLSRGGRLAMLQQLNALGICFRPFRMYREVIKLVKNV